MLRLATRWLSLPIGLAAALTLSGCSGDDDDDCPLCDLLGSIASIAPNDPSGSSSEPAPPWNPSPPIDYADAGPCASVPGTVYCTVTFCGSNTTYSFCVDPSYCFSLLCPVDAGDRDAGFGTDVTGNDPTDDAGNLEGEFLVGTPADDATADVLGAADDATADASGPVDSAPANGAGAVDSALPGTTCGEKWPGGASPQSPRLSTSPLSARLSTQIWTRWAASRTQFIGGPLRGSGEKDIRPALRDLLA